MFRSRYPAVRCTQASLTSSNTTKSLLTSTANNGYNEIQRICGEGEIQLYGYYVFSVRCWGSFVPLLFISCTPVVHLLYPCCSSYMLLLCISSTSCTSHALFKFLYSSSAFHLISRCPVEAHSCPSFVPISLMK